MLCNSDFFSRALLVLILPFRLTWGAEPLRNEFQIPSALLTGKPVPVWRGGLIALSPIDNATDPGILVVDGNGSSRQIKVEAPGAVYVRASDAVKLPDGRLAVATWMVSGSGQASAGLHLIGADGKVAAIRRTNPFRPQLVTVDNLGKIWLFGQNLAEGMDGLNSDHFVFQVLDSNGGLLETHTLSSTISRTRLIPLAPGLQEGQSALLAAADRVGLYIARLRQWREYSTSKSGDRLGEWTIDPPTVVVDGKAQALSLMGMAFTQSGRLFAFFYNRTDPLGTAGYYELDRKTSAWRLSTQIDSTRYARLWGADGDRLLVLKKDQRDGFFEFEWINLPASSSLVEPQ